jgi:hypothetical protein
MRASNSEFIPTIDTLDNLAFDALQNYSAWMRKVHQSGLQTVVPEAELRQNVEQYCNRFLSLPKNYETRRIYANSDTRWMAGDVVHRHSPSTSNGRYISLASLCNIGNLYRLEDSPSDTPDITGAYSHSGLVEMEVSSPNGSKWTRRVVVCLIVLHHWPTTPFIPQGICLMMRNRSHSSAIWMVKVTCSLVSQAMPRFGQNFKSNYHPFLSNSMSLWMSSL